MTFKKRNKSTWNYFSFFWLLKYYANFDFYFDFYQRTTRELIVIIIIIIIYIFIRKNKFEYTRNISDDVTFGWRHIYKLDSQIRIFVAIISVIGKKKKKKKKVQHVREHKPPRTIMKANLICRRYYMWIFFLTPSHSLNSLVSFLVEMISPFLPRDSFSPRIDPPIERIYL